MADMLETLQVKRVTDERVDINVKLHLVFPLFSVLLSTLQPPFHSVAPYGST